MIPISYMRRKDTKKNGNGKGIWRKKTNGGPPMGGAPKTNVTGGILEEECRQLMQDFFRNRR